MRAWLKRLPIGLLVMRLLIGLLVLTGVALVTAIGTVMFGRVDGAEFAPDTFEHREYLYYELPIVRLQVTPIWRTTKRSTIEQALVDRQLVVPSNPPARWDLLRAHRRGQVWREGDAQILGDYLDAQGESSQHWLEWSDREPKLAAVLWPEVANVSRADLYIFVPDLFELAANSRDPTTLATDLHARLARRYEELADLEMGLGNYRSAERFFVAALNYEPERATSVAGRDRARELGGEETGTEETGTEETGTEETGTEETGSSEMSAAGDPPPTAEKAEEDNGP